MRQVTGWGVKTSCQGETALWERYFELYPNQPEETMGIVDNLLMRPDFQVPSTLEFYRFWTLQRLQENQSAADFFRSLLKAVPNEDIEFLFCLAPVCKQIHPTHQ